MCEKPKLNVIGSLTDCPHKDMNYCCANLHCLFVHCTTQSFRILIVQDQKNFLKNIMQFNHTLVPCSTQSPVADDPSFALVPLLFDPKTQNKHRNMLQTSTVCMPWAYFTDIYHIIRSFTKHLEIKSQLS